VVLVLATQRALVPRAMAGIVGSPRASRYPGDAAALADLCSDDPEFP
jgi:hypothetical protein